MLGKVREKVKKGLRRGCKSHKRERRNSDQPSHLRKVIPKRLQRAFLPKGVTKLASSPQRQTTTEHELDENEGNRISLEEEYPPLPPSSEGSYDHYAYQSDDQEEFPSPAPSMGGGGDGDDSEEYPPLPSSSEGSNDHYAYQSDDQEDYPSPAPSMGGGDNGNDSHDSESQPPLSLSSKAANDGSNKSDDEEVYPPLPSSDESNGYSSRDEEEFVPPPLPPSFCHRYGSRPKTGFSDSSNESSDQYRSLSSRNTNRGIARHASGSGRSDESSSSGDFRSVRSRLSSTGITPEMSEHGISEHGSQAGESDAPGSSLEVNVEEYSEGWNSQDSDGAHDQFVENVEEQPRRLKRARSFYEDADGDIEMTDRESSPDSTAGDNAKRARRESISPYRLGEYRMAFPNITTRPEDELVIRYRTRGARYQEWIDNPNEPDCPVQRSTANINSMIDSRQEYPWRFIDDDMLGAPMNFAGGETDDLNIPSQPADRYRYTRILQLRPPSEWRLQDNGNSYIHRTARGVIVGEEIFRYNGLHWNEVAQALYEQDFRINTLRHIVFTDLMNEETNPYIRYELYPVQLGIYWSDAGEHPAMVFEHGNAQYQELLGTALGRSAASFVLGAFPRGTMRIARIVTWYNSTAPQIRFELEPIVRPPVALPPAA